MRTQFGILALVTVATGCSFIARGPDQYRADTRSVLETQNAQVKACYDDALQQNPAQSGKVVVNFTVEKKTGQFTNIAVDPNASTAPDRLQQCVVKAVEGLKLAPEDRRDGEATFEWVFRGPDPEPGKPAA
jgi:hypothetical protein